jgi:hypothetical protein
LRIGWSRIAHGEVIRQSEIGSPGLSDVAFSKSAIASFHLPCRRSIIVENLALTPEAVCDFPAAAKAFDRAFALVPNSFEAKSLRARVETEWKGDLSMMKNLLASLPPDFESFGMVTLGRFNVCFFRAQIRWSAKRFVARSAGKPPRPDEHTLAEVVPCCTGLPAHSGSGKSTRWIRTCVEHRGAGVGGESAGFGAPRAHRLDLRWLGAEKEVIREGNRALELLPESKDAMDALVLVIALARIHAITGDGKKAIDLLQHSLQTPAGLTCMKFGWTPPGTCCAKIRGSNGWSNSHREAAVAAGVSPADWRNHVQCELRRGLPRDKGAVPA